MPVECRAVLGTINEPPSSPSSSASYLHVPLEIPIATLRMRHIASSARSRGCRLQIGLALESPIHSASRFGYMIRFIGVIAQNPRSPCAAYNVFVFIFLFCTLTMFAQTPSHFQLA